MLAVALHLHWLDYVTFFGYFALLSVIGYFAGRKQNETADSYFLAGRSLPWYIVGSSYIAANISTEHFIGLIGAAVIYGICVATGEWSSVIAFSFLVWIFIPYLFTSKVYTAPEFLEKRFNGTMRATFATVTVVINIVAFLGPVIYGGALVVEEIFGFNEVISGADAVATGESFDWGIVISIFVIAIASGVWAIWGGLRSIASMDGLTILVMIIGGLTVTFCGLSHLGAGQGVLAGIEKMIKTNRGGEIWSAQWIDENVPNILQGAERGDDYNRLSVLQPINHYSNPWTHWVFSFFYIGLWYTVINQHMIQKVLAAKDMYHARMGIVFASFLKLLLPVIVVIPGLIYFAMKPEFLVDKNFSEMSDAVNKTYILLIKEVVPVAFVGVLLAALFGAIQSTVCSVLNSTSTILTMDFYRRFFGGDTAPKKEVAFGRLAGMTVLGLSIGVAVLLATAKNINLFIWIQMLYVFFAPPFSATFLLGTLWKRVSGFDAVLATFASFAFAICLKILEFKLEIYENFGSPGWMTSFAEMNTPSWMIPFANQGMLVWIFCMVVCCVSALLTPSPVFSTEDSGLIFDMNSIRTSEGLGNHWYTSVIFWWGMSFALMLLFVLVFSIAL